MPLPEIVTVVIECPKGSNYKLDYQPAKSNFRLSKILPAGLTFPFDFGMIPGTRGEDGDPLDIMVVSELSTFPGCEMDVRLIGALAANQTERDGRTMRNDRYLGIPIVSQLFPEVNELAQLPESILNQLEHFFKNYNEQAGKQFSIISHIGAAEAAEQIALSKQPD